MPIIETAVEVPNGVPIGVPIGVLNGVPNGVPKALIPEAEETPGQNRCGRGRTNADTFFYNATHPLGGVG